MAAVEAPVKADGDRHVQGKHPLHHLAGARQGKVDRFFAIDRLARPGGGFQQFGMRRGRAGDQHSVDGVATESLAHRHRPGAIAGGQRLCTLRRDIGHHRQLAPVVTGEAGGMNLTDKTTAYQGKTFALHFILQNGEGTLPP